jgi:F-type H+-transporting ATPase subunit delta
MSADVLVQRYSQALFQTAEANKKTEQVGEELAKVSEIFNQSDVLSFFGSPFNSGDNKLMVAKSALEGKCSAEVFNFLITLVQNERVAFLSQINEAYQASVRAKGGETEGVLYVATEASDGFKSQVESKLSQTLNKKVKLSVQKDPLLLSGYKVVVGGWTMDDSAQYHLNKIKEESSKRGI